MTQAAYDLVVVGGGIVGLATAMECVGRFPALRVAVVEKEPDVARHQTSHNSGVIHSGIYYRPGSMKARTCVEGARLMRAFCEAHGIAHAICGKLIVATHPSELPALQELHRRGVANGIAGISLLGPERLREIEPHARGLQALHVPSAGVVDYAVVARAFAEVIRQRGGTIMTSALVRRLIRRQDAWVLETTAGSLMSRHLVTAGGLHADRVAAMAGAPRDLQIIPFRGDYYELIPLRRDLVRTMIYPVPDPALPFLGVHLTRGIDGRVHAGPNAVLALKREGYRKTDVNLLDLWEMMRFSGFWRMACKHWAIGAGELVRAASRRAFVRSLQRLVPEVCPSDVVPCESGVRAQAVDRRGVLVDDFNIVHGENAMHLRNVPSPAATASISIARVVAGMAASALDVKYRLDEVKKLS